MAQASARSSRSTRTPAKSAAAKGAAQVANQTNLQQQEGEGTDKTKLASVAPAPAPTTAPAPAAAPAQTDDMTARANAIIAQNDKDKAVAEGKADMDMSRISHKAIVAEVAMASGTFRTAINLEVAACLAVYWQAKGVNVGSKKELYSVYSDAGYDCAVGGKGKDYKTVNRRIGYIGRLFESLPEGTIEGVVGDKNDSAALQSLVGWASEKYQFKSMNDVLIAAGVEPPSVAQYKRLSELGLMLVDTQMKGEQFEAPTQGGSEPGAGPQTGGGSAPQGGQPPAGPQGGGAAPSGGEPQGQQQTTAATGGVAAAVQQAGEQRQTTTAQAPDPFADNSKWVKVQFEGATLVCPVDMRTECLHDLGMKLIELAHAMGSDKIVAEKVSEKFKELAHH